MRNTIKRFNSPSIAIIALVLALTAGITVAFRSPIAAQGDDEAAARQALLQNAAGFERNDLAAVSAVWADDEAVTVFENGSANYGWADYRDHHLGPEIKEMKNVKYPLTDIKVRVSGKTAWATFKYAISADFRERHMDSNGLGTAVLEKRARGWQIVHWHTSSSRRPPAPAKTAGND